MKALFLLGDDALKAIYAPEDGRAPRFSSVAELEAHWEGLQNKGADPDVRVRDGHCHEAVMWYVHHLSEDGQAAFGRNTSLALPLLPLADHTSRADGSDAHTAYSSSVTCQKCHVGGIDNLGVPEVKPETDQAMKRRCYTNYKELFNITCGPCDGISGIYWGDQDKDFSPPPCTVVAQPHEVPEEKRVKAALPHQFKVHVQGSDRMGRTTNPFPHSNIISKIYGQIHGTWWMDHEPNASLAMLRHDTTYGDVHIEGQHIPGIAPFVSEIHVQSTAQKKANITGQMVSLIKGLPSWMPGGCTCIPDPVGVPDITTTEANGLAHMEYMGRINIQIEYEKRWVELDHWANWFFHIFMETDKTAPMYGQAPKRLASAYAGMAVYSNWTIGDPKLLRPDVWYGGIPTTPEKVGPDHGKFCMNPKKVPQCNDISLKTFPPPADLPVPHDAELVAKSVLAPRFFPMKPELEALVAKTMHEMEPAHETEAEAPAGPPIRPCTGGQCASDADCQACGTTGKCSSPLAGSAHPEIAATCVDVPTGAPEAPAPSVGDSVWPTQWVADVEGWTYPDFTSAATSAKGRYFYDGV